MGAVGCWSPSSSSSSSSWSCSSGKKFLTSWETINHQANSMLASMFKGTFNYATDEDGFAFIDRDGEISICFLLLLVLLRFFRKGGGFCTFGFYSRELVTYQFWNTAPTPSPTVFGCKNDVFVFFFFHGIHHTMYGRSFMIGQTVSISCMTRRRVAY